MFKLVASFCIFCIVLAVNASEPVTNGPTPFGYDRVVNATIQMYHADWEDLLATADEENWYPANLYYDDAFVQEVGVRTKGHSSLSGCTGSCTRFSLKVDMQKYVDNQTLFGEHEINFNNVFKDPSYMREAITWKILREYVPAEQTAFADLYVQTEREIIHLGFYTVIQQVNKQFLSQQYPTSSGDLYKLSSPTGTLNYLGDSFDAYANGAELKTNKQSSDGSSFVEFVDKINHDTSVEELRRYVNIDDIVYTMAVLTAVVDLDSPIGNGNNFYVYQSNPSDPSSPLFTIIPWDVNEAFGTFSCGRSYDSLVSLDIFAPVCGQISQFGLFKLLEIEEFRNLYISAVEDVVKNYFNLSWISEQVEHLFPIISPFVAADDNSFYTYDQFICATSLQSSPPSPPSTGNQQPPANGNGQQQPPSNGNQQPPSNGNGQQQPPSNGNQQPPSNGNQQPPSNGNQQPPSTGNQQPPSNGNQQPPSNGNQQPPSNGNQQPPSNGNQQPPSNGNQQPPSNGNQQPPSNGNQQPPSNGSGNQQPPSNGNQQPPSNGSGNQQPPSNGNQQPPSNGNQQPPSNGSGQQQPPSNGGQQPPSNGNQQPPSTGNGNEGGCSVVISLLNFVQDREASIHQQLNF